MGLPAVVVQEGGYDLGAIGALACEFLAGLEEARMNNVVRNYT